MTEWVTYTCKFCKNKKAIPKCEYEKRVRNGWPPKWCQKIPCMSEGRKQETAQRRSLINEVRKAKFPILEAR